MNRYSISGLAIAAFLAGCASDGGSTGIAPSGGHSSPSEGQRASKRIPIDETRDTHKFVGEAVSSPLSAFSGLQDKAQVTTGLSSIKTKFSEPFASEVIDAQGKLISSNLLVDKIVLNRVIGNAGLQSESEFGYTSLNVWSKNYNDGAKDYKMLELATAIPADKIAWINANLAALKTAVGTMTAGGDYAAVVAAVNAYMSNPSGASGGLAAFLGSNGAAKIITDVWPLFAKMTDPDASRAQFLAELDTKAAVSDDQLKFALIDWGKRLYALNGLSAFKDGGAIAYDGYVKGDAARQITNNFVGMNQASYTFTGKAVGGITQKVSALGFADESTSFVRAADLSGSAVLTLNPKSRKDDTLALAFGGLGMVFKTNNAVEVSGAVSGFDNFAGGKGTFDATYYGLKANSVVNGSGAAYEALGRFQYSHAGTGTDIRGAFGVKRY